MENCFLLSTRLFFFYQKFNLIVRIDQNVPSDFVGLSSVQRGWLQLALNEDVDFETFQLSSNDRNCFAGRFDLEVILKTTFLSNF